MTVAELVETLQQLPGDTSIRPIAVFYTKPKRDRSQYWDAVDEFRIVDVTLEPLTVAIRLQKVS